MRDVGMTWDTLALVFTALGGVFAYSYQQVQQTLAERRALDLERCGKQLEEFYGPLVSLLTSQWRIFKLFAETETKFEYPSQMREIIRTVHETPRVRDEYKRWMRTALLPLHRSAAHLVDTKAHLFETARGMTTEFQEYVAMVRSYDVILSKWDDGIDDTLFSPIRYPEAMLSHCTETFHLLRRRQADLLCQPVDPLHIFIHRRLGDDSLWLSCFGGRHPSVVVNPTSSSSSSKAATTTKASLYNVKPAPEHLKSHDDVDDN